MNGRLGRRDRPEVLRLALVEDVLNDRQRPLLDAAKVVAPLEALRVELVDIFGAPRGAPRTSSQGHLANLTSRTSAVDCLARWRPGDTSQTVVRGPMRESPAKGPDSRPFPGSGFDGGTSCHVPQDRPMQVQMLIRIAQADLMTSTRVKA
jgi:hypothetical protein